MVGGGKVGMEVLLVALSARIMRWAVGGRWSHPLVYFSASRWAATTAQSASAVCSLVSTLANMPVRPIRPCGDGLGGVGRLVSVHRLNQTCALVHTKREWRYGDLW